MVKIYAGYIAAATLKNGLLLTHSHFTMVDVMKSFQDRHIVPGNEVDNNPAFSC